MVGREKVDAFWEQTQGGGGGYDAKEVDAAADTSVSCFFFIHFILILRRIGNPLKHQATESDTLYSCLTDIRYIRVVA